MKKRNQATRILLGIFLPALIASIIFMLYKTYIVSSEEPEQLSVWGYGLPWLLNHLTNFIRIILAAFILSLYAAAISGLQSVLYSLTLEYLINPKVDNDNIATFIHLTLGLLSGWTANMIIREDSLIIIGGLTGLIVGHILRTNYKRSPYID